VNVIPLPAQLLGQSVIRKRKTAESIWGTAQFTETVINDVLIDTSIGVLFALSDTDICKNDILIFNGNEFAVNDVLDICSLDGIVHHLEIEVKQL
jgi:hypothetical protein